MNLWTDEGNRTGVRPENPAKSEAFNHYVVVVEYRIHTARYCVVHVVDVLLYDTLQRVTAHCSTLQYTATHCNTLQHTMLSASSMCCYVTRMNESCHKYELVTSHIRMSHVAHMNESRHTCEWVMAHTWMSHIKLARKMAEMDFSDG